VKSIATSLSCYFLRRADTSRNLNVLDWKSNKTPHFAYMVDACDSTVHPFGGGLIGTQELTENTDWN